MHRSTPEEQGIAAPVIDRFIAALDDQVMDASSAVHSVLVVRHGLVIGEASWHPFRSTDPHMLYSLSKSFVATAIGLAVFERLVAVDDLIVDLLPDDLPSQLSPNLAAMTVGDLLTMTSGHAVDSMPPYSAREPNWARAILAQPIEHVPGTHFVYNSGATYLLSAILHRLTGMRVLEYLTPRLFDPLGILGATWETCPRGIDAGGWGLAITTEAIAAFGQLLLAGGVWNGRQLVPREWVTDATSAQVSNGDAALPDDGTQGYGYQFWRNRHQSYRADGAFGQMCLVIPEHDVVVAMTSGHADPQRVRDILWATLLPDLESAASEAAPAATPATVPATMEAHVGSLELPHPVGEARPTSAIPGEWMLDANPGGLDSVSLEPVSLEPVSLEPASPEPLSPEPVSAAAVSAAASDGRYVLRVRAGHAEIVIECGYRDWRHGRLAAGIGLGELVRGGAYGASGAWVGDEFTAVVWLTGTPYAQLITLKISEDRVDIETRPNVSFADPVPTERLVGHR